MCDVDDKILLVLVGRGPEEEMVKQLVYQNNLEKYVKFLGVRDDVPDLMNMFDAFIFPSTYEGLGIVGIEAQSGGVAVFLFGCDTGRSNYHTRCNLYSVVKTK